MTETERLFLDLASQTLDYPDDDYFRGLPALREQAQALGNAPFAAAFQDFINGLEKDGALLAQQKYVAVFDHDPDTSLYLAWHRYGNDRGQGKALAALNGLYRAAGLEPVYGSMPDYLPRMMEFMAFSEDWAIEVMLDGFGPEMARLLENLERRDPLRAKALALAYRPLREKWPDYFKPRSSVDATRRPMAQPEPETPLRPLHPLGSEGQEEEI